MSFSSSNKFKVRNSGLFALVVATWTCLVAILIVGVEANSYRGRLVSKNNDHQQQAGAEMVSDERLVEFIEKADLDLSQYAQTGVRNLLPKLMESSGDDEEEEMEVSEQCMASLLKMITKAGKLQKWPFEMLDSMGKPHAGIFLGNGGFLGDVDECLQVKVPKSDMKGQYCLVGISNRGLPVKGNDLVPGFTFPKSFTNFTAKTEFIKMLIGTIPVQYEIEIIYLSMCIPTHCSFQDFENILKTASRGAPNHNMQAFTCFAENQTSKLNATQITIASLLSAVILLVVVSTFYDGILNRLESKKKKMSAGGVDKLELGAKPKTPPPPSVLRSMSLLRNLPRLFSTQGPVDTTLRCFNGIRFASMCWVVLGHTVMIWPAYILRSSMGLFDSAKWTFMMATYNGFFPVDTFLFISSVLFSYLSIKSFLLMGNARHWSPVVLIVRRVLRMLPVCMAILGLFMLLPPIMYGPMGEMVMYRMADDCYRDWWKILSFGQNYLASQSYCALHLWYISADMQLYVAAVIYISIYIRSPLAAKIFNLALMLSGILTTGAMIIRRNWPANVFLYTQDSYVYTEYFSEIYNETHAHSAVYGVGLFLGTYLANRKYKKADSPACPGDHKLPATPATSTTPKFLPTLSKTSQVLLWLVSAFFMLAPCYSAQAYYRGHESNLAESLLIQALGRPLFGVGLAIITLMCAAGNADVLSRFLAWKGFIVLNRPSFSVYLVHILLLIYISLNRTAPFDLNNVTISFCCLGFVVLSFMMASIFHLLIECPISTFELTIVKLLFVRAPKNNRKQTKESVTKTTTPTPPTPTDTLPSKEDSEENHTTTTTTSTTNNDTSNTNSNIIASERL